MIAVIFEVFPKAGARGEYLGAAAALRKDLDATEGFISIERFESLSEPGKLLSLSFWKDEDAVRRWRNFEGHRHTQHAGRDHILEDYRLRVASVVRDYAMFDRVQAPADSKASHGQ